MKRVLDPLVKTRAVRLHREFYHHRMPALAQITCYPSQLPTVVRKAGERLPTTSWSFYLCRVLGVIRALIQVLAAQLFTRKALAQQKAKWAIQVPKRLKRNEVYLCTIWKNSCLWHLIYHLLCESHLGKKSKKQIVAKLFRILKKVPKEICNSREGQCMT